MTASKPLDLSFDFDDKRSVMMSEIMPPEVANFSGNVHGGHLMLLLDKVAYTCAAKYSGKNTVTLSADQILFKEPIYVGELVTFFANVNYVGRTSMEIGIKVIAENVRTGVRRHTNTCFFTMVAVDDNMKPCAIEPLKIRSKLDQYRFNDALFRKEQRIKTSKIHADHKNKSLADRESN